MILPGKIDGHAITREVRLWHGCPRIEFDIDLNTMQPDNGIFCIRFPLGLSGKLAGSPRPLNASSKIVAGIPFGVESRDHLAKEPFRGESFCPVFPKATTPRDGPTSRRPNSATRSSVRPACSPAMPSRKPTSRSSSF